MIKKVFSCSKCDAQHPKWAGRCLECGAWGTLQESSVETTKKKNSSSMITGSRSVSVASFGDLSASSLKRLPSSGFPSELLFPKGIVLGSISLFAGEPGAGKSTLSLQIAKNYSMDARVLYISAEESATQIKERGDRFGEFGSGFMVAESSKLEEIVATVREHKPSLVIIDSIQTIMSDESEADFGSINQIKIVTAALSQFAKEVQVAIIAIGHVTKDGALAGPKSLEHLVDAVYYLESDRNSSYRLLRCFKNRYGESTSVIVMKLTNRGMQAVPDAATVFIHNYKAKPGSVLTVTSIDDQMFFLEIQSLVSKSSFGYAKRTSSGFPKSRLEMLLAIMKKKLHMDFDEYDVYVNIAGGFRVNEPALDLAVVLSIISSVKETSLPATTVVFGEVGLSGEIRLVKDTASRLKEIARHKFNEVYIPPLDKTIKTKIMIKPFDSLVEIVRALKW